MGNYEYLAVGIIMGIAISVYVYISREERIEREIEINKKIFSTRLLDVALEKAVNKMKDLIKERSRELSEEEKNEIIFDCLTTQKTVMSDEEKK